MAEEIAELEHEWLKPPAIWGDAGRSVHSAIALERNSPKYPATSPRTHTAVTRE